MSANGEQSCVKNLDDLIEKLDQYENNTLYETKHPDPEGSINEYLNMKVEDLLKLDGHMAAAIANKIAQYSLYVQRLSNKENGIIKWCDAVISSFAAKHWDKYSDYIKADIKIAMIIRDDEALTEVLKLKNHAAQRLNRLSLIPATLKYLSDTMIEISRNKRSEHNSKNW